MKIALLGHMGRDEALADRLVAQDHQLHVIGQWENPGLFEKTQKNYGSFHEVEGIKSEYHIQTIGDIVAGIKPDMFLTNFDDALGAGVVDEVQARIQDILIPSPNKEAARVEWDKFFCVN